MLGKRANGTKVSPISIKSEESSLLKQVICQFSFLNVIGTNSFSYQFISMAPKSNGLINLITSEQKDWAFLTFMKVTF